MQLIQAAFVVWLLITMGGMMVGAQRAQAYSIDEIEHVMQAAEAEGDYELDESEAIHLMQQIDAERDAADAVNRAEQGMDDCPCPYCP